jgi:hypothetical protein
MEFPRLVFKSATDHKLVETQEEFNAAMKDGWFASVPEAKAKAHDVPADNAPPTRAELEAKATELQIKFDGRTTDVKLTELINKALA